MRSNSFVPHFQRAGADSTRGGGHGDDTLTTPEKFICPKSSKNTFKHIQIMFLHAQTCLRLQKHDFNVFKRIFGQFWENEFLGVVIIGRHDPPPGGGS